ncbi:SMI1/KNR4 family protein [Planktothrix sp.]|uniref:SMI1/KNR4 family protein n=2 Tax=Planktothrix sp. TaxID=3088171 RepID=UPI0038D44D04
MQDAARHPQLFVWNGTIESNQLELWLQEHQLNLPQDLIELWKRTNGGDLFESETILSPFGDDSLGDDIESVNEFHDSQGMSKNYLLFHVGTGLSAVRLTDGYYVKLDESYQEIAEFQSLDDWYRDELREEYAKRYNLELEALKDIRQRLIDRHEKGLNFLNRKERRRFDDLKNRLDGEIRQCEETMLSENITKRIFEPIYAEIKLARKNSDRPELQEAKQILDDIYERFYALEADRISEREQMLKPDGWLLPTSTLSKPDFKLLNANDNDNDIDSFFRETLMIPERIKKTLSNWKEEPFVNKRYRILEQAVEAHLNQQFYLSVSTLMPQIEGLLRDVLDAQKDLDSESKEEIKKAFKSLEKKYMKKATRILTNAWNDKIPKLLKSQAVMLESLPDLVGNLYKKYEPETEVPIQEKIYRHGICHGLQLDFGSEKNSLQLILLLDRIIYFTGLEES